MSIKSILKDMSEAELIIAFKNLGCDLELCGACAEAFFTGQVMNKHTCSFEKNQQELKVSYES